MVLVLVLAYRGLVLQNVYGLPHHSIFGCLFIRQPILAVCLPLSKARKICLHSLASFPGCMGVRLLHSPTFDETRVGGVHMISATNSPVVHFV